MNYYFFNIFLLISITIFLQPLPEKHFFVHIDTVDSEQCVVRISFSNTYKEFRSTNTWLQFPFVCVPGKGFKLINFAIVSKVKLSF